MLRLRDLVKTETQLVYLTATMRPRDEAEFIWLMGLPAKEKSHWSRGVTTRKNVEYQIRLYNWEEEGEAVKKLVEERKRQYPIPGQIIVYCNEVEKTVRLATGLGCVCYHRQVGSRTEKSELVRQLTEGIQQAFTATNALGLGVNAPTIRAVIYVGVVRKLRDYGQESGRAGRDGLKSEAIILRGVQYDRAGKIREGGLSKDVEEDMLEFITTEGCMRVILDREMDGRKDRVGCEDGEEKCDGCRANKAGLRGEEIDAEVGIEEEVVGVGMEEEVMEVDGLGEEKEKEAEMIEFKREVERRRLMAVKEMELQSREMLEV